MVYLIYGIIDSMNYKMIIQYEGTRYNGWQKQGNTENTIQGRIEIVLARMAGYPVEIHGAGRTDAGVHAYGQVANFHLKEVIKAEEIRLYLNHYLPDDIDIISLETAKERFHSRLNAKEKVYCYRIGTDDHKQVFERKFRYHMNQKLDVKAMRLAASSLMGEHDFRSFCANRQMKKSTVRYLRDIEFQVEEHEIKLIFRGDGFLYQMVRILTGTLIEVGQNKRAPEEMTNILEGRQRQLAGFTAPAQGLALMQVMY